MMISPYNLSLCSSVWLSGILCTSCKSQMLGLRILDVQTMPDSQTLEYKSRFGGENISVYLINSQSIIY